MRPRRSFSGRGRSGFSVIVGVVACLAVAGGSHAGAAADKAISSTEPPAQAVGSGSLDGSGLDVAQGQDAVEQLEEAGTLDEVADDAGLEPDELKEELLEDSSLFVTRSGFVGYADALEASMIADTAAASLAAPMTAAALPANVFALGSRPSASRVIFLDFDGHAAADPAWGGAGYAGTIVSAPFDTDGSPGFSAADQGVIFEVWQRVAEDFRPFDVNVTTMDPGIEGLRRSSPTDTSYGQRLVVTPSTFTAGTLLGIALVGVFDSDQDHAAYVFTDATFKQAAKTVADAASHEVGHTFGLSHDAGIGSPSYYEGHGAWAPIMGRATSPSRPVTQWSRGEYAGATNVEDDLAIIERFVGYRPDDHGQLVGRPTVVPSNSTTSGFVGNADDRDVFAVDVADGTLSVTLRPPSGQAAWSNLAAKLTVRNAAGAVVATGEPSVPSGWMVALSRSVPAGRYTFEVEPVGWLTGSTGFTTYGSLGAYELVVDAPPGVTPTAAGSSAFTPITPTRLVDTRTGSGGPGRVKGLRQIIVPVATDVAVPADATAAVFNVTAVNPSGPGFVTVHPCEDTVPDTSTLNFVAGQTVANTTIAALSRAGQVCVWTYSETDILVDITGWLSPRGSSRLTPIGPTRVVDTRSRIGGVRLRAGATLEVDVNGVVPAGSTAVALNVTAVNAPTAGFLTVFPCNAAIPNTSTVNYVANEARPNNTIVGLSGGRICIFSDAATDVLVDLVGSFGPTGLGYQPTPPVRVLDTRSSGTLGAGVAVGYSVGAAALGGRAPGAAYVNVTAANHLVAGYVTTYDCVTRRDTSTLNQRVGQANANGAIVPLSALQSCAFTFGGGDLIVDLNGWWVP